MTVLFDSDVHVHYGFVHVDSGVGYWDQEVEQCAGQRNGLLGAAQPGSLLVRTGMHTGLVPFRVEAHSSAPTVDHSWDEIVEASCDLRGPDVMLSGFDWNTSLTMPRSGPHRVRLSARDYGAGREQERYEPKDPVQDSYLLQFWPAPMAPDDVVTVTSPHAAYWHDEALAHPDAPVSAHEQALVEEGERHDAVVRRQAFERASYLRRWGGRDPSPRLLEVQDHALGLVHDRRDLVDAVAAAPPDRQRALALDLARRVCADDDGPLDWQPALDALAAGRALPPPFDDDQAVMAVMFGQSSIATATVERVDPDSPPPREPVHTGVTAAWTVLAAAARDPLEAALRAIASASWTASDEDAYFAQVTDAIALG